MVPRRKTQPLRIACDWVPLYLELIVTPCKSRKPALMSVCFVLSFLVPNPVVSAEDNPPYDFELTLLNHPMINIPLMGNQSFTATVAPLDPEPPGEEDLRGTRLPSGAMYLLLEDRLSGQRLHLIVQKNLLIFQGSIGQTTVAVKTEDDRKGMPILHTAVLRGIRGESWEFPLRQDVTNIALDLTPVREAMAQFGDDAFLSAAADALQRGTFHRNKASLVVACQPYLTRACAVAIRLTSLEDKDNGVVQQATRLHRNRFRRCSYLETSEQQSSRAPKSPNTLGHHPLSTENVDAVANQRPNVLKFKRNL